MKADIFRKTLDYWLKRSAAGDDQYDVEWRGETAKFHQHFEGAMLEAYDNLFATMRDFAMGGVVYKYDEALLALGFQGPDAYQRDEYGDPVPETLRKLNPKMLLRILEWKRPESTASIGKSTFRISVACLSSATPLKRSAKLFRRQASKPGSGSRG